MKIKRSAVTQSQIFLNVIDLHRNRLLPISALFGDIFTDMGSVGTDSATDMRRLVQVRTYQGWLKKITINAVAVYKEIKHSPKI